MKERKVWKAEKVNKRKVWKAEKVNKRKVWKAKKERESEEGKRNVWKAKKVKEREEFKQRKRERKRKKGKKEKKFMFQGRARAERRDGVWCGARSRVCGVPLWKTSLFGKRGRVGARWRSMSSGQWVCLPLVLLNLFL